MIQLRTVDLLLFLASANEVDAAILVLGFVLFQALNSLVYLTCSTAFVCLPRVQSFSQKLSPYSSFFLSILFNFSLIC